MYVQEGLLCLGVSISRLCFQCISFLFDYQREACSSHQLTPAHFHLDRFPRMHFFCNSSTLEGEGSMLQYETGECCLITQ